MPSDLEPSHHQDLGRPLRLFYAAGPGDVIGTYRHWREGRDDPSQVAVTYSGQFFDVCRNLGAEALVISSHSRAEVLEDTGIRIEHRPGPPGGLRGVRYHFAHARYTLDLINEARRFQSDIAIISDIHHWFLLTHLTMWGLKVIPTLHCAFWPVTRPPTSFAQRLLLQFQGRFWRRSASATICVSPECERQLSQISGSPRGPIYQCRAFYRQAIFETVPLPPVDFRPFRILYAGRLERNKGVFDLLQTAFDLEQNHPGLAIWEICGTGSAEQELRREVDRLDLANTFRLMGYLRRDAMQEALGRSHVVVVPTTSDFAEGLNKVVVEAVLAGRPVLTSVLSNALDVLGEAIIEVPPDNPPAIRAAILQLAFNPDIYNKLKNNCDSEKKPFLNEECSWGAALKTAIFDIYNSKFNN